MTMILRTSLCFILLLTASFSLQAEEPVSSEQASTEKNQPVKKQYYIVEVVLFQHLNEQGKLDEFWSKPNIFADALAPTNNNSNTTFSDRSAENNLTDDTPALAEYDLQNKRFSPLRNGIAVTSAGNYKLSDSAAHLRYSKDYKLLAHFGWTQRSLSKKRALPIRITSNEFSDSPLPSGELKLYVSRYLHMLVNLKSSKCDYPSPQNESISDEDLDKQLQSGVSKFEIEANLKNDNNNSNQCVNKTYQFTQNRKMRSRELHYIDNPVYGMLVYVTPYTVN